MVARAPQMPTSLSPVTFRVASTCVPHSPGMPHTPQPVPTAESVTRRPANENEAAERPRRVDRICGPRSGREQARPHDREGPVSLRGQLR